LLLIIQTVFASDLLFDKSEYAARRSKLMEKIPDGVAIVLGAMDRTDNYEHYQNNDFVYFSGVEIPNAMLVIDGIRKESVLFFTISKKGARNEGLSLELIEKPVEITGIEKVKPIEDFSSYLSDISRETKTFYTSFIPEELMRERTLEKLRTLEKTIVGNEWDGRLTREMQFVGKMKAKFSSVDVRDLSTFIRDLRIIKSPAEIDMLRLAGRMGVRAHIELMKSVYVGMKESELAALFEYVLRVEGAQELGYSTKITSGPNHPYLHYHKYDRIL